MNEDERSVRVVFESRTSDIITARVNSLSPSRSCHARDLIVHVKDGCASHACDFYPKRGGGGKKGYVRADAIVVSP